MRQIKIDAEKKANDMRHQEECRKREEEVRRNC